MPELRDSDILTDKQAESFYVQSRVNRDEVAAEYARMTRTFPEYISTVTKELSSMRLRGIPDRAAYAKLRDEMTKEYDRFRAISQRMVDFAEEMEDAYTAAMETEISLELYDKEVAKLLYLAAELELNVQSFAKQGMLDKFRPTIQKEMQDILGKLKELDSKTSVKDQSRERESLIDVLGKIDERLDQPEKAIPAAAKFGDSRSVYSTVKAQYAAVQHTLSEDQRRAMRLSIARLREAVSQAEDEARPSAIRYAVAHATEHAPALATAVFASLPRAIVTPHITQRRGLLATLSAALKLK